jgi:hypothetical protein
MTVAPSLFGVSWYKKRRTKNKMTRFLPARIFSVFVPTYDHRAIRLGLRADPSGLQKGIPGIEENRMGCEKASRGSRW